MKLNEFPVPDRNKFVLYMSEVSGISRPRQVTVLFRNRQGKILDLVVIYKL